MTVHCVSSMIKTDKLEISKCVNMHKNFIFVNGYKRILITSQSISMFKIQIIYIFYETNLRSKINNISITPVKLFNHNS